MNQTPTRINQFFTALFGLGLLNQPPTLKKCRLVESNPCNINVDLRNKLLQSHP